MKGISLHEPWASAIAHDLKRIETRGFQLHYRGMLAICAARTTLYADRIHWPEFAIHFHRVGIRETSQLHFGHIVAVCRVAQVIPTEQLVGKITPQEQSFGNYEPGRFGWVLQNLTRLKTPIPFRGHQGLINIPGEIVRQMQFV